jgi:hypothetical protein
MTGVGFGIVGLYFAFFTFTIRFNKNALKTKPVPERTT